MEKKLCSLLKGISSSEPKYFFKENGIHTKRFSVHELQTSYIVISIKIDGVVQMQISFSLTSGPFSETVQCLENRTGKNNYSKTRKYYFQMLI